MGRNQLKAPTRQQGQLQLVWREELLECDDMFRIGSQRFQISFGQFDEIIFSVRIGFADLLIRNLTMDWTAFTVFDFAATPGMNLTQRSRGAGDSQGIGLYSRI